MAHWHALAKLRMHNDLTLQVMDSVTKSLGHRLRAFKDKTCAAFATKELRREYDARMRRRTKKTATRVKKAATHTTDGATENSLSSSTNRTSFNISIPSSHSATNSERLQSSTPTDEAARVSVDTHKGRRPKTLSLNTYNTHSLGDYPRIIREYGTTDSFSTEPVG
jgi:hypothetical protein